MKKIITLLLSLIMVLSTSACNINTAENNSEKLKIIATIFPQYDFAREIAGDKAQVEMLISPGTESHSFEPTTSDIMSINECDIFIYTGGDSDTWIDNLLKNTDNPKMTVISLMDCVDTHIEETHHHEHNHSHNHSHTDEHVWTSPVNSMEICEEICSVMCEKDPANAEYYKQNLSEYLDKLGVLDNNFKEVAESAQRSTLIFADRFPLKYFAQEYGLDYHAAFSGCSDDTEPSASTVAELINIVRSENIPVVLKIELSSDSIASTISKETGAKVMTFYSCHNISREDFSKGETYLSLMQKNVQTLKTALN